jgi:type II secretory pathway pseudopilin PulG
MGGIETFPLARKELSVMLRTLACAAATAKATLAPWSIECREPGVLGILVWLALIVGTLGVALIFITSPENAARAMAALAAGSRRWQQLEVAAFERQAVQSSGFWMSFHELTSGYPWLTKRVVRVMDPNAAVPRRNAFAYLLALCVPYAGRLGGGFGFLILVYLIFVLAAVAIPAYHDYQARAALSVALSGTQPARDALTQYYLRNGKIPESLEAAGIDPQLPGGAQLSLDVQNMALTVSVTQGELVLTPRKDAQGRIIWGCTHGEGLRPNQVPPMCRDAQ